MRTARASGWRCIVAIARSRPTATPACGPPISLSPENSATSTPAATESRTSGSSASPYSRGSSSAPLPRSSSSSSPRSRASDASAGSGVSSVKPTTRKFEACTRSSATVRSLIASA